MADKAAPFVVNFEMVDTDKDGKVTQAEFKEGCKKGWIQEQPSKSGETGGGETPRDARTEALARTSDRSPLWQEGRRPEPAALHRLKPS
jgi:hypothetical protein